MCALAANRDTPEIKHPRFLAAKFTVLNDAVLYAGAILAIDSANEIQPAADTAGLKVVGRCPLALDNAADGLESQVEQGVFRYANSGTYPITRAMIGRVAYVENDETVGYNSTNKVRAGLVYDVDSDGVWVDMRSEALALAAGDPTIIVVGKSGDDVTGIGSFAFPYATITKALSVASTTRKTIFVLPGTYAEAATLTWPSITGLSLVGLGPVSISNGNAAAQVLLISPTFTASSFEATIKNVNIAADTQIGIAIRNANMTKKLIVTLDGVSAEMDTSGDSVDILGTVSGQAIRVYVDNCDFEGLVHATFNDAGSRLRCATSKFVGGITTAGAVAAELSLRACQVLYGALTIGDATWNLTYRGSMYQTDADPAVYSELADGYSA